MKNWSASACRLVVALACLIPIVSWPAPASAQEAVFTSSFEEGNSCDWSDSVLDETPLPEITGVFPIAGGLGAQITIEGTRLGDPQHRVFLSGGVPWGSVEVELDVAERHDDSLVAALGDFVNLGPYDVVLQTCRGSVVASEAFEIRLPADIVFTPRFVAPGDQVVMTGSFFGAQQGRIWISNPVRSLPGTVLSWQDTQVVFVANEALDPNGPRDVQIINSLGTVTFPKSIVVTDLEDGDEEGPRLVSAVATSNTEIIVQFNEIVRGGPEGAENPSLYRITGPPATRIPTLVVLSAEVLAPTFDRVRLTTLSQADLLYTLQVSAIQDLAGNPMAPPDILIDPSKTTFYGVLPGGGALVDSDGDGFSDLGEQKGWTVTVELADGSSSIGHVTSDPGDPRLDRDDPVNVAARDTDADGVGDLDELYAGMSPRTGDTDADGLTDNEEWNIIYSNPTSQDTDGDGTQDGFEFYSFRTSPVLADTDGDQLTDTEEVIESNRNPRIADLPRSAISVGEVRLQIDERFTYENAQGNTVTIESASNSTLSQSQNRTLATSDTTVNEFVAGIGFETGYEPGKSGRGTGFFSLEGSFQYTRSNTFQTDQSSAIESQRVHEQSLRKAEEINTTSTITRNVVGARIDVDLTIRNAGDLAFTISDLEVTVLQRSKVSTGTFIPVATLIANSTLITGEPASFSLGPFTPERGPILFSSRDVFPNLVEELMKGPSGLIFKVANFSMTDELGRQWTFANQTARDRTAGIIVDFGDGTVERHLVATALQPDVDGVTGLPFAGGFDKEGLPLGIPLDYALRDILNLPKNSDVVDGIVAGPNKVAESIAQGDDVQVIPPGTTGVGVGSIVVSAGLNGLLETETGGGRLGDDELVVTRGYETSQTCSAESDNVGEVCTEDADCTGAVAACSGPEILVRFGSHKNGDFRRGWAVLTTRELPAGADFGKVILKPGEDLFFAFVQDLDNDGVFAREEYIAGSTDSSADLFDNGLFGEQYDENAAASQIGDGIADSKDTDRDGLGDLAEIRIGWKVATEGGLLRDVRSSPRLRDSDGDGLLDPVEMDLRRFCAPGDLRTDALCAFQSDPPVDVADAVAIIAGPNRTADSVAVGDDVQLVAQGVGSLTYAAPVVGPGPDGVFATVPAGDDLYESLDQIPPASDPTLGDTDGDVVPDGAELTGFDIGVSVRDGGGGVAQTQANGDDIQKAFINNPVKPGGIVILPGPNGTIDSVPGGDDQVNTGAVVLTDPLRRDTDNDLVDDGRELDLGGDPTDPLDGQDFRDSDQDGLTDSEEADLGWEVFVNGASIGIVKSSPSLPDSDLDGLPDFLERDIRSNPNNPDTDGDGLRDFDEFADFERFVGLEAQFPRFFVDGASSKRYGTNPWRSDSDLDGLTDFFELIEGYRILLAGEQEFRQIFTNPLVADTDFDGRSDLQEQSRNPPTDASDPDTDDDGRTDGQEALANSDPLVRDLAVEITMQRVVGSKVTGDGGNNVAEMTWWFTTQGPGDLSPVLLTSPHRANPQSVNGEPKWWVWGFDDPADNGFCQWYWMEEGYVTSLAVVNSSRTIVLTEGQSFALNGLIGEIDDVSEDCGRPPNYIPSFMIDIQDSCVDTFNEIFTYNDFVGGTTGQLLTAGIQGVCEFEVQYSIEVK